MLFHYPSNHRRTRGNAELCKNAAQMRADGPSTYIQEAGNRLVWIALGHHANYLLLARCQGNKHEPTRRPSDQQIARAIAKCVYNYFCLAVRLRWSRGRLQRARGLADKFADQNVEPLALRIAK